MKISIIIPVYNSSFTLKECLDSIFSSTFKDYEVIVVSGNSTDDSIKIAKQFQIKIIELPENKGPAFARNEGAKISKGDILLFIDSLSPEVCCHHILHHLFQLLHKDLNNNDPLKSLL